MLLKQSVYPKTSRIGKEKTVVITEKVDGSNLVFFKKDGELYIAQRNTLFSFDSLEEARGILYKGLYQWLLDNGQELKDSLNEGSGICGEWVGMGQIKYGNTFNHRFLMFAKTNIREDEFELKNIIYKHELFQYPFVNQTIPSFIGVVPVVKTLRGSVSINELDALFTEYEAQVGRHVEGFVIYDYSLNGINKYVRRKGGTLQDHKF